MIKTGMIHGRFQPFHNGHFDYLKESLALCEKLVVGITNPEPSSIYQIDTDDHRHKADANPFSYYDRLRMIHESIIRDTVCSSRINDVVMVPFPIHSEKLWQYYLPMKEVTQFIRILEEWDGIKKTNFEKYGFTVEVLEGSRIVSGTEIRSDINANNQAWRNKVPEGTLLILNEILSH